MSKPTDLPVWASDTNFPAGTDAWSGTATKVEPTSGKQDEGWEPAEKPPAQWMNWWMNLVYQWILWLDGLFGADGTLTLDTDADMILQGEGEYCHNGEMLCINPSALLATANGGYNNSGGYFETTGAGSALLAIPLKKGDRIYNITFSRYGNGVADFTQIQLERWGIDMGAGPTLDLNDSDINPAAAWAQVDKSTGGANPALTDDETYNLRFNYSATGLRIGNIRIDYDHPQP